jgi:hypothetical protein
MKIRRNSWLFALSLSLILFISPLVGVFWSSSAQAVCVDTPWGEVCHQDLDPTRVIPGSAQAVEQLWGEAGAGAYQAAANWMRANNGSSQSLDTLQKQYLRPHFGDLVDRVAVVYNANLMDELSAGGYRIPMSQSAAQTYCDRIYVDDPYQQGDLAQIVLLAHELTHSRQCQNYGGAGTFGFHYFREYKRAGQNYANNRLEREAFDFEAQFASTVANQPPITELGFYREGNQDAVYLVFRPNGRYCHVQNPDQMNAFGGSGQVRSISSISSNSSSGGFSGECGFPNGFYRLGNQDAVYWLNGNAIPEFNVGSSYCHVVNRQQMEAFGGFSQVRSVATTSDIGRGRDYTGSCQNP